MTEIKMYKIREALLQAELCLNALGGDRTEDPLYKRIDEAMEEVNKTQSNDELFIAKQYPEEK